MAIALIFVVIDINIELGIAFGICYVLLVLLSLLFKQRLASIILAAIATICIFIGWYLSPENPELWQVFFNRVISVLLVWVIAFIVFTLKRKKELNTFEEFNIKINSQLAWQLLLLVMFLVSGISTISYIYLEKIKNNEKNYIAIQQENLETVKSKTKSSLQELFSDVIFLSKLNTSKNIFLSKNAPNFLAKDFSELMRIRGLYDQIRFIDSEGYEKIRVNYNDGKIKIVTDYKLQNKANHEYFKETIKLKPNEIYVSKIDLNYENGKVEEPFKPVVRVATLVKNEEQQIIGLLVINYLASELLNYDKQTNEASNKIELLNEDGYWLAGVKKEKLFGFTTVNKQTYAAIYPNVWNQIKLTKKGVTKNDSINFIYQRFSLIDVFYEDFVKVAHVKTTHTPELIIVSPISKIYLSNLSHKEYKEFIFILSILIFICFFAFRYLIKKQREINYTYSKFNAVFNQTFQFIGLLDPLGKIIEINNTALDFGGITRKEVLANQFWDLPLWGDNSVVIDQLKNAIKIAAKGKFVRYEVDLVGATNNKITVDFSLRPVHNNKGEVIYLIPEGRDITDKNKLQEKINHTNQLFEEAQSVAKIGVWSLAVPAMDAYWSDEVYRIHGLKIGTKIELSKGINYYHPAYRQVIQEAIDKSIAQQTSWDKEAIIINQSGKEIWVRAIGYPIFEKGKLIALRGLFMDIDDKKRAQISEAESKEKLKHLNIELKNLLGEKTKELDQTSKELLQQLELINSGTIISSLNKEGRITHVNNTFCEISGYSKEELIGVDYTSLKGGIHSEDFFKTIWTTINDGVKWKGEICNKKKDGALYWTSTFIFPFKDKDNNIEKFVGLHFDITELKENQKELEKQTKKLELVNNRLDNVNKELETFSYSVSHDLKAPLRALQGFSDNLHKKYNNQLDDTGVRWLGFIKSNAERMNQLIVDILSFSRINRKEIDKKEVDVNNTFKVVLKRIELIYKNKLDLQLSDLPNCKADQSMIEVLWENLIHNAFKYSSKNDIISIKIEGFKDKNICQYSITDNGTGFDMKYYDKLFGVFQRLHANDEYEGTGVGLANVKRIIEKHGGKITAESTIGKGAKFEFTIPN